MMLLGTAVEAQEITREDIIKTVEHMRQLNADTLKELADAKNENLRLAVTLSGVQTDLSFSKEQVQKVEKEMDDMRQWALEQQQIAETQTLKAEKAQKLADHRGNLIGLLGAAALTFLAMSAMKLLPTPYNFALPILAAPIGYFFARLFL